MFGASGGRELEREAARTGGGVVWTVSPVRAYALDSTLASHLPEQTQLKKQTHGVHLRAADKASNKNAGAKIINHEAASTGEHNIALYSSNKDTKACSFPVDPTDLGAYPPLRAVATATAIAVGGLRSKASAYGMAKHSKTD